MNQFYRFAFGVLTLSASIALLPYLGLPYQSLADAAPQVNSYRTRTPTPTPPHSPPPTPTPTLSPCSVSGYLYQNTVWRPSICRTYTVVGDLTVNYGVTLDIEPGTVVQFSYYTSLYIYGALLAQGTPDRLITFTSQPGSNWNYIAFEDSSVDAVFDSNGQYLSGSIIQYATIENGGYYYGSVLTLTSASPFIDHNTIRNNYYGGVNVGSLYSNETLHLTNNTFTGNGQYYSYNGEAIAINDYSNANASILIQGNSILSNSGGGLYCNCPYSTLTILNNIIDGNSNDQFGGTYVHSLSATMTGNQITNNSISYSGYNGAGLYLDTNTATVQDNTITGNSGTGSGGGLYSNAGTITIQNNTISNNSTSSSYYTTGGGGGIYLHSTTATISHNTITGNSTGRAGGGGIYVDADSTATIHGNTINGNTGGKGGGIYFDGTPGNQAMAITENLILSNVARQGAAGGGVYVGSSCQTTCQLNLSNNEIFGNLTNQPATTPNDLYNGHPAGTAPLHATNNFWGTTNPLLIAQHIWDHTDDYSLGIADYTPYRTENAVNVLANPGFESGPGSGWVEHSSSDREIITTELPHTGRYSAHECGYNSCTESIQQPIPLFSGAHLTYWWYMNSDEDTQNAHDFLQVQLFDIDGQLLRTLRVLDNTSPRGAWMYDRLDLSSNAGRTVLLRFTTTTDGVRATNFYIDDVSVR